VRVGLAPLRAAWEDSGGAPGATVTLELAGFTAEATL